MFLWWELRRETLGLYFVVVKRRVAELFVTSVACLFAMGGWSLSRGRVVLMFLWWEHFLLQSELARTLQASP